MDWIQLTIWLAFVVLYVGSPFQKRSQQHFRYTRSDRVTIILVRLSAAAVLFYLWLSGGFSFANWPGWLLVVGLLAVDVYLHSRLRIAPSNNELRRRKQQRKRR